MNLIKIGQDCILDLDELSLVMLNVPDADPNGKVLLYHKSCAAGAPLTIKGKEAANFRAHLRSINLPDYGAPLNGIVPVKEPAE